MVEVVVVVVAAMVVEFPTGAGGIPLGSPPSMLVVVELLHQEMEWSCLHLTYTQEAG